jgi:cytochrome c peroxidase
VYANIGKAIAAFERRIDHAPTRFDRYVAVELAKGTHTPTSAFSKDEEAGLRLFIGKANCVTCHNGARLSDESFHNTGVAASPMVAEVDSGRTAGVRQAIAGEFNCLSRYSDARPEQCSELRFARTTGKELVRAYKTTTLRGVAERAPYMHAGQLASLADVVRAAAGSPVKIKNQGIKGWVRVVDFRIKGSELLIAAKGEFTRSTPELHHHFSTTLTP